MEKSILTIEMRERALCNYGNPYRLLKLIDKAKRGESITFVALGGSITQGYNSTNHKFCYAARIAKWLEHSFPQCTVNYINAGIGATGSLIALHRLKRDVLDKKPDLVTVEFSVNEGNNSFAQNTYDNLLYNILNSETNPAVLMICMIREDGFSAQNVHLAVGKHYDLPVISYGDAVWEELKNGKLNWTDLSNDNIHPHDYGHELVAKFVTDYIETLFEKSSSDYKEPNYKNLMTDYKFKNPELFYVDDIAPYSWGCFSREEVNLNKIPYGWVANENGNPLQFKFFNCKRVYVLIEKTNRGDGGKAEFEIEDNVIELDADFKDGWGVYYNSELLFSSEIGKDITITVKPVLKKGEHFAIAGIMLSY